MNRIIIISLFLATCTPKTQAELAVEQADYEEQMRRHFSITEFPDRGVVCFTYGAYSSISCVAGGFKK